jgi:micrococcal nuclease
MDRRARLLVVACVVLAAAAWAGGTARRPAAPAPADAGVPAGADRAAVVHVIDGDTVRVRVGAAGAGLPPGEHRVRLLGIDTPELDGGTAAPACGAIEATAFLTSLLDRGEVWLLADREDRDRFDRPLRYLWTDDGTFVNRAIIRAGHGHAVAYEPNVRYAEVLRAAESRARAAGAGVWGACTG